MVLVQKIPYSFPKMVGNIASPHTTSFKMIKADSSITLLHPACRFWFPADRVFIYSISDWMKAALLVKQWSIWCIANIYSTGRLISIMWEAGGMLSPAERHCLDCVRNQAGKECGPVERSLGREQDPVASCDTDILCVAGQVTSGKVSSCENWGEFGMSFPAVSLKIHPAFLYPRIPPL